MCLELLTAASPAFTARSRALASKSALGSCRRRCHSRSESAVMRMRFNPIRISSGPRPCRAQPVVHRPADAVSEAEFGDRVCDPLQRWTRFGFWSRPRWASSSVASAPKGGAHKKQMGASRRRRTDLRLRRLPLFIARPYWAVEVLSSRSHALDRERRGLLQVIGAGRSSPPQPESQIMAARCGCPASFP